MAERTHTRNSAVVCPVCNRSRFEYKETEGIAQCGSCKRTFTIDELKTRNTEAVAEQMAAMESTFMQESDKAFLDMLKILQ